MQADATAVLGLDLVEDLADRALLGEVAKLGSEVLLQGLVAALGLALQSGVDVLGDIADENMRHACIMLAIRWTPQGVVVSLEDASAVIAVVGRGVFAALLPWAAPSRGRSPETEWRLPPVCRRDGARR